MTSIRRLWSNPILLLLLLALLAGCNPPPAGSLTGSPSTTAVQAPLYTPTSTEQVAGLTPEEIAILRSLERVDGYPLYTMRYFGSSLQSLSSQHSELEIGSPIQATSTSWGCSLFAAFADPHSMVYGRNFDWEYSPALLLFNDPPDGYASASMVALQYLDFRGDQFAHLAELPLSERRGLLGAPRLPFDGMNEHGLVVGMAAVPPGNMQPDPGKETLGSLGVIREMLDHARDIDQAVEILQSHNIDFEGGPPLHYLLADATGRAALVEFYQGKAQVIPNEDPWHQATNFLLSATGGEPQGQCWRYDKIQARLNQEKGGMTSQQALRLLAQVAQDITQWSIVYEMSTGEIRVAMGKRFESTHIFHLMPDRGDQN